MAELTKVDSVIRALVGFLTNATENWQSVDWESYSLSEQKAFNLLFASQFVEVRVQVEFSHADLRGRRIYDLRASGRFDEHSVYAAVKAGLSTEWREVIGRRGGTCYRVGTYTAVRLTEEGSRAVEHSKANLQGVLLLIHERSNRIPPIPPVIGIEGDRFEAAAGDSPANIAAAQAIASVGDIHNHITVEVPAPAYSEAIEPDDECSDDCDSLPNEYRDREQADGEPLTVAYLSRPETYNLSGSFLSKQAGLDRIKYGRGYVYRFDQIAGLSAKKNAGENDGH